MSEQQSTQNEQIWVDPVVVAVGGDNENRILLSRQPDRELWALPGGIAVADSRLNATVHNRLSRELSGVNPSDIPALNLDSNQMPIHRSSGTETLRQHHPFVMVHHTPAPELSGSAADTRWFTLQDAKQLEKATGGVATSHLKIIGSALSRLTNFEHMMTQGQRLHQRGKYSNARMRWEMATKYLPDPLEKGRAHRGVAASAFRQNAVDTALAEGRKARQFHERAMQLVSGDTTYKVQRERAESSTVLGRMMLRRAVDVEHALSGRDVLGTTDPQEGLSMLESALNDLRAVESFTGEHDQHMLNLLSRLSLAHSLYGNHSTAKQHAAEARRRALFAESANNKTSAHISASHQRKAAAIAVGRAGAATTASLLANKLPTRRRALVRAIALDPRLGF